jgi:hypothetical protein
MAGHETVNKLLRNIAEVDSYAGMRHYMVEELVDGQTSIVSVEIPGTFCKVFYVPGLNATDYIAAGVFGSMGRVLVGTDEAGEMDRMASGYDERLESLWFRCRFRLGTTYRFGTEMGLFELAAS